MNGNGALNGKGAINGNGVAYGNGATNGNGHIAPVTSMSMHGHMNSIDDVLASIREYPVETHT